MPNLRCVGLSERAFQWWGGNAESRGVVRSCCVGVGGVLGK